jgi:hypothetical protein
MAGTDDRTIEAKFAPLDRVLMAIYDKRCLVWEIVGYALGTVMAIDMRASGCQYTILLARADAFRGLTSDGEVEVTGVDEDMLFRTADAETV